MPAPPVEVSTIRIPAAAEHIAVVRAFIGAVGRHFGCSEETVEDLRLAATETCAQALEEGTAVEGFEVKASFDDGSFVLEIEPAARFVSFDERVDPLDPSSGDRRRNLISALFPDVVVSAPDGASTTLRLRTPCDGSPADA